MSDWAVLARARRWQAGKSVGTGRAIRHLLLGLSPWLGDIGPDLGIYAFTQELNVCSFS
ncbi:MAG: hypothetical protein QOE55_2719 [Acidobacteriaceae bacterium]|nr:hypothetical protein [Acidobacteriaceae bacterium]